MSKSMTLFRCPYCAPAGWHIAVDVDALVEMSRVSAAGTSVNVRGPAIDSQRVVILQSRQAAARPCPHLISFYVDVDLKLQEAGGPRSLLSVGATFDHPWYEVNDPGQELSIYLWTEWGSDDREDGPADRPRLVTPYYVRTMTPGPIYVPPARYALIGGTAMWAFDPVAFLEALRDGYRRWCEYRDRSPQFSSGKHTKGRAGETRSRAGAAKNRMTTSRRTI